MYRIGYTQGVFDMFHIGHLNLINRAKAQCEILVVGVNSDQLVERYKDKVPVIKEYERAEIVRNLKAVDWCFIVDTLDKEEIYKEHPFDVVFIGDDWKGNARWMQTEIQLSRYGVEVVYLPHTADVSSTNLREEVCNSAG